MRKILCKILTLGRHWWVYKPFRNCKRTRNFCPQIRCKICEKIPKNQWLIYELKFKGRKKGKYVTNNHSTS